MPVLGIDLGGTKLLAGGLDDDGVTGSGACDGRGSGPHVRSRRSSRSPAMRSACSQLDGIGIGVPGLVDHARGLVRSSTILDGWSDIPLASEVSRRLDLPCTIDNDVNVAAIHERDVRGARDLLYVAIGTGIGGALVLGGTLWRGAGSLAGEIGHVSIERDGLACTCGRRGCVNLYASGTALGPSATDAAIRDAAEALAIAIGSVLNVLDLPLVVLGGGVVELGARYVDAVADGVRRQCFREIAVHCAIEPARAGYDTAALGAAVLAGQPRARAISAS